MNDVSLNHGIRLAREARRRDPFVAKVPVPNALLLPERRDRTPKIRTLFDALSARRATLMKLEIDSALLLPHSAKKFLTALTAIVIFTIVMFSAFHTADFDARKFSSPSMKTLKQANVIHAFSTR
jgi:hypothetical protein